jgi:uncharacterized protein (DUF1684 family)
LPEGEDYVREIREFQEELDVHYADSIESPLSEEDRLAFGGLPFYPVDEGFRVIAEFTRTPDEKPFPMPTSSDRTPIYVKYGILKFFLQGQEHQLSIYQNQQLQKMPGYEDYLFLPFTDLTSGDSSYGGGRYIDIRIPKRKRVLLDFNKAYNPYCAYSDGYSCPIPPKENDLAAAIKVGVMYED